LGFELESRDREEKNGEKRWEPARKETFAQPRGAVFKKTQSEGGSYGHLTREKEVPLNIVREQTKKGSLLKENRA